MKFYNREAEFRQLENLGGNFRVAVIGRRRIGKTSLVENFYRERCLIFFIPAEKAEKEIVASWVSEYPKENLPKVESLQEFFTFVFSHYSERVIFIDELQNVLKVNKSFLSELQHLIDQHKPKLVISGSLISMMKEIVEGYKSPLYGRFDLVIRLKELDFPTIRQICKDLDLDFETALMLYAVFGGVPKYYDLVSKLKQFEFKTFVSDSFITYPRPLYEEARTMLKEEFGSEHKTLFSILSAISQGKNRGSEIAGCLGKNQTEITKYLAYLEDDFEIIERETPVLGGNKGVFSIRNQLFLFWFGSLWRYNEFLEKLQEEEVRKRVGENLHIHISKSFERLMRDLVRQRVILSENKFDAVGRQWGRIPPEFKPEKGQDQYEIDICAYAKKEKTILFGECKWQEKVDAERVARELSDKTHYIAWHRGERKETLAIFAKSFSKTVEEFEGKKVLCYDLKRLEKEIEAGHKTSSR